MRVRSRTTASMRLWFFPGPELRRNEGSGNDAWRPWGCGSGSPDFAVFPVTARTVYGPSPPSGNHHPASVILMALRLYDTLTREKREFVPHNPERVTMYVCGPTVYNYAHIGNARPVVAFDVLFRILRHLYGDGRVIYAANVTDVDDKINAKAAAEGVPISTITARYLDAYHADMSEL